MSDLVLGQSAIARIDARQSAVCACDAVEPGAEPIPCWFVRTRSGPGLREHGGLGDVLIDQAQCAYSRELEKWSD